VITSNGAVAGTGDVLGVLSRDFNIRLINCSPSGCLLEANAPLEVGTVGSLRLEVDGHLLADHLVVVRCRRIEGAGPVFHVGARFLWIASPTRQTVRRSLGRSSGTPLTSTKPF